MRFTDDFIDRLYNIIDRNKDREPFLEYSKTLGNLSKSGVPMNARLVLAKKQSVSDGLSETQRLTAWLLQSEGQKTTSQYVEPWHTRI